MMIIGVQFSLDALHASSTDLFDLTNGAIGEIKA